MSFLKVENVSKHFGSLVAVDGVTMTVEKGECRAIIGPNGAGKTTFFNLITGMLGLTTGRVLLDGKDLAGIEPDAPGEARHGADLPDHRDLPRTVGAREYPHPGGDGGRAAPVALDAGASESRGARADRRELLEEGGLTRIAHRLAGELSHGDQRACEIMMALALNPRLLLLDEPTAGMGDDETYAVARLIKRIHRENLTIVLIEHDMRVVFNLADRITVLAEGKPLAEGTPAEITANEEVQAAYLGGAA